MQINNNVKKVFSILDKFHEPTMLVLFKEKSAFEKLVATMLSARAKDSTVIPIVLKMFEKWPEAKDYLDLDVEIIEKEIYSIGFYKNKARNLKNICFDLVEKFDGIVPNNVDDLISLPGVGRKTANCILNYHFGIPAIAVDIHVHRIANRLGWIKTSKESESEKELMRVVSKEDWIRVNSLLVGHGQTICSPRNPVCGKCSITMFCDYFNNLE